MRLIHSTPQDHSFRSRCVHQLDRQVKIPPYMTLSIAPRLHTVPVSRVYVPFRKRVSPCSWLVTAISSHLQLDHRYSD